MKTKPINELKAHLAPYLDLNHSIAILSWDQEVFMPPGGGQGRARQLATLSRLSHEILTESKTEKLLFAAEQEHPLDFEDMDSLEVRQIRRIYDQAIRLPSEFVSVYSRSVSESYQSWVEAKESSDFSLFQDSLKKILDLNFQKASYLNPALAPYDLHLDLYEPGITTKKLDLLFESLRAPLEKLTEQLSNVRPPDPDPLEGRFDPDAQWKLTIQILTDMGYDFERGRQDRSLHPFTTSFGNRDVRVTTRIHPELFTSSLFSSIHEGGHALYEQGIPDTLASTVLGEGASLGIHESQSRLWENMIGRSKPFLQAYLPLFRELFPGSFSRTNLDQLARSINRVQKTPIRVESDEVTYNLHIFIRYRLEKDLFENKISIKDLRDAWNELTFQSMGFYPRNDSEGVLQDVHWSHGAMGYFPTYTIGNVLAAMLYEKMNSVIPNMEDSFKERDFSKVLAWLRTTIHQYGAAYRPEELVQRIFQKEMEPEPFLNYLQQKYSEFLS